MGKNVRINGRIPEFGRIDETNPIHVSDPYPPDLEKAGSIIESRFVVGCDKVYGIRSSGRDLQVMRYIT